MTAASRPEHPMVIERILSYSRPSGLSTISIGHGDHPKLLRGSIYSERCVRDRACGVGTVRVSGLLSLLRTWTVNV